MDRFADAMRDTFDTWTPQDDRDDWTADDRDLDAIDASGVCSGITVEPDGDPESDAQNFPYSSGDLGVLGTVETW